MDRLPSRLTRRAQSLDLPFGALTAIVELRDQLEMLEARAIEAAREKGATWEDIASALGISRQALQQRLARRADPRRGT